MLSVTSRVTISRCVNRYNLALRDRQGKKGGGWRVILHSVGGASHGASRGSSHKKSHGSPHELTHGMTALTMGHPMRCTMGCPMTCTRHVGIRVGIRMTHETSHRM